METAFNMYYDIISSNNTITRGPSDPGPLIIKRLINRYILETGHAPGDPPGTCRSSLLSEP